MKQGKTLLVHGRFQPFHNGHLWLVTQALAQAEHVLIGICTPEICSQEIAEQTGYPCTAEQNPFSYTDRVRMITESLSESGIEPERYTCMPFPSDYSGVSKSIPHDTIFLLSVANEADTMKADFIRTLGYSVETVQIPNIRSESGSHIRSLVQTNDKAWHDLIPPAVRVILDEQFEANR